jgi:hypothetical protein
MGRHKLGATTHSAVFSSITGSEKRFIHLLTPTTLLQNESVNLFFDIGDLTSSRMFIIRFFNVDHGSRRNSGFRQDFVR